MQRKQEQLYTIGSLTRSPNLYDALLSLYLRIRIRSIRSLVVCGLQLQVTSYKLQARTSSQQRMHLFKKFKN